MPPRNAAKRQNCCAATRKVTPRAAKGFNWIVRIYCLCALVRGLQNLEASLKGFNCCGAKLRLRRADLRFAEPRKFPKGRRVYSFCVVQKVTKKHVLGRAKSCRWQVFVRRRPPKQGELQTDVSKATMFQGVGEALRPTIQSSAGEDFSKVFRRHEPKPVFRTNRRRKGFESVRGSSVTA